MLEIRFKISEKRPPLLAKMLYADEEFHNVRSNPIFLLEKEQFEGLLMQAAMRGGELVNWDEKEDVNFDWVSDSLCFVVVCFLFSCCASPRLQLRDCEKVTKQKGHAGFHKNVYQRNPKAKECIPKKSKGCIWEEQSMEYIYKRCGVRGTHFSMTQP